MGKRSDFEKIPKDAYMTTDPRAVKPLLDYLDFTQKVFLEQSGERITYYEPCVGDGSLVKLLEEYTCIGQSDEEMDARSFQYIDYFPRDFDFFITNPPWTRKLLHPIIENLRVQKPTWLLFDADWMHTQQAIPFLRYCKTIISVGRLKWIPGSTMDGKDNCAWYLFVDMETDCTFIPRKYR